MPGRRFIQVALCIGCGLALTGQGSTPACIGDNDIDYEHKYDTTNRTLSHTFGNNVADRLIVDALLWLGLKGPLRSP